MTTIDQIKQECRAIIALAEKATPGPWRCAATFFIGDSNNQRVAELMGAKYAIQNVENGDFIATSRSFTPRAARALLNTIEYIQGNAEPGRSGYLSAQSQLEDICATWEGSK